MSKHKIYLFLGISFLFISLTTTYSDETSLNGGEEGLEFIRSYVSEKVPGTTDEELSTLQTISNCYVLNDIENVGECKENYAEEMPIKLTEILPDFSSKDNISASSELTNLSSYPDKWSDSQRIDFCEGRSGFNSVSGDSDVVSVSSGWYYCSSNSDWRWFRRCTNPIEGGEGRCQRERFSVEHEGEDEYRLKTPDVIELTEHDWSGNQFTVSKGSEHEFTVTGDKDYPTTIEAPDFEVKKKYELYDDWSPDAEDDIPVLGVHDTLVVRFKEDSYTGGNSNEDEFDSVTKKEIDSKGLNKIDTDTGIDKESPGVEKAKFKAPGTGMNYVEVSVKDDTPGDGLTTTQKIPVWSGGRFTEDYTEENDKIGSGSTGPEMKARKIKDDWNIFYGEEDVTENYWDDNKDDTEGIFDDVGSDREKYYRDPRIATLDKESLVIKTGFDPIGVGVEELKTAGEEDEKKHDKLDKEVKIVKELDEAEESRKVVFKAKSDKENNATVFFNEDGENPINWALDSSYKVYGFKIGENYINKYQSDSLEDLFNDNKQTKGIYTSYTPNEIGFKVGTDSGDENSIHLDYISVIDG